MSFQCNHAYRNRLLKFGLVAILTAAISQSSAHAQGLKAQNILEPIVENFDAQKYADVDAAITKLLAQDLQGATASLEAAYQKNRELPPSNIMLAQILFRLRQLEAGKTALEKASRETPSDPAAYIYLGELALQQGRQAEATAMYNKGIDLCGKYTENNKRKSYLLANGYGGLALMEEQKQNWPQAKQYLDQLLKYDDKNILARTRLGRVLFKMAKDQNGEKLAYKEFIDLHKLESKAARAEVNMGLLYEQDGRRSNAEKMMALAIKNDGNSINTRLAVAKWAMDAGKLDVAQTNAVAAAKIDPKSLDVKLINGLIYRYNSDFTRAEQFFKDAHFQSPTHLGAMSQLALALIESTDEDKRNQALAFAELSLRIYSDMTKASGREAGIVYAWCLSKLGRGNEALRAVANVVNKGPVSSDSAYFAAQILHDSGRSDVARQILEPTLKSGKSFPNRDQAEKLLNRLPEKSETPATSP